MAVLFSGEIIFMGEWLGLWICKVICIGFVVVVVSSFRAEFPICTHLDIGT